MRDTCRSLESPSSSRLRDSHGHSPRPAYSHDTGMEHDALVVAMNKLEGALAAAAPGRTADWARRVGRDLRAVQRCLEHHVLSSEGSDGLFRELDLSWPTQHLRVEELRNEHERLLTLTSDLIEHAKRMSSSTASDYSLLRGRIRELLTNLRNHQASETDLIYECYLVDIGVGD